MSFCLSRVSFIHSVWACLPARSPSCLRAGASCRIRSHHCENPPKHHEAPPVYLWPQPTTALTRPRDLDVISSRFRPRVPFSSRTAATPTDAHFLASGTQCQAPLSHCYQPRTPSSSTRTAARFTHAAVPASSATSSADHSRPSCLLLASRESPARDSRAPA